LVPVAGVAGVGGVLGGLGRAPQLGKAGVEACINAIGGLLILAGAQVNLDVQTRTRRDTYVTFYRGVTYYDGLRAQEEGFDAGGALSRRQSGRAMAPGLYTSRNRAVAVYFAYINSDPFLGAPGQGGPALMTITLSQRTFNEIAMTYGVLDNQPVVGLPFTVPEPHVETFFPYPSLGTLYAYARISIELLPLE
ncbi:MAG: hypothetical protein MI924_03765, partial [Chloroflexales bacterium]|nr:hypothetical protein [Chloroflexales bacterium]